MSEVKNIPRLRFPGFNDDWGLKTLGDLGKIINGITYNPTQIQEDGVLVLRSSNIQNGRLSFEDNVYISVEKYNPVKKNDILICVRNGSQRLIGKNALIYKDFDDMGFGAFMTIYRSERNPFLYHWFDTEKYYKEVHKNLGATINSINGSDLKKFKVPFPSLPEQQKIADFLTGVDKRIELLEKKKTLLETYKKGVMKKIFNQEIRFKDDDGNDFPDWEERKLKDLITDIIDNRGKTPPVSSEGIPLIEVNAIGKKNIDYSKIKKYVDQKTYDSWFRKHLIDNDILFSTVGQTAICSLYKEITKSCIAQNIVGLRFKIVDQKFMYYLLTEATNNHQFKRIEMGAVQPSVKVSQMIHLKFSLPNVNEQVKISHFLSSLDTQIELLDTQIDKSKTWKKGLLQKMFM